MQLCVLAAKGVRVGPEPGWSLHSPQVRNPPTSDVSSRPRSLTRDHTQWPLTSSRSFKVASADTSVLKHGKTPQECLRNKDNLPLQCQHLLSSFSDCKRGLVSASPWTSGREGEGGKDRGGRSAGVRSGEKWGPGPASRQARCWWQVLAA